MFTRKTLNEKIREFLLELENNGFRVTKVILYGSYATGKIHENSDIDLAIWLSNFPKKHWSDILEITHIVAKHSPISPKFYPENETENEDPFIGIIEKTGRAIDLQKAGGTVIPRV
ncbi:MAG TPA: nucleotidyltransferase domain-containing protein [Hanamia sp.]|nr:nucleotidyltransferase domain-containing protein [Hanamia sp.]